MKLRWLIIAGFAFPAIFGIKQISSETLTNHSPKPMTASVEEDLNKKTTSRTFNLLMNTVSEGWNEGNAKKAADCFTEDAVYTEPPDKQVYVGRTALYEFFGGDKKPEPPMKMIWHHLAFDEKSQIGFGEYTFQMNNRYHGVVVVKIRNGKISNWREYQYQSNLEWKDFIEKNKF